MYKGGGGEGRSTQGQTRKTVLSWALPKYQKLILTWLETWFSHLLQYPFVNFTASIFKFFGTWTRLELCLGHDPSQLMQLFVMQNLIFQYFFCWVSRHQPYLSIDFTIITIFL